MRIRSLNLDLPQCLYGTALVWGRYLQRHPASGRTREGSLGSGWLYPEPGCVGPRWLIWAASPGEYWNARTNRHGILEGMRVE